MTKRKDITQPDKRQAERAAPPNNPATLQEGHQE